MFRSLIQKINLIGKGTKDLFFETKDLIKLRLKPNEQRTRREKENIRQNNESLKKISVFLIAQSPPIIGYLPVIVAFRYPRYILTSHYWTEEQHEVFLNDEFMERQEGMKKLHNFLMVHGNIDLHEKHNSLLGKLGHIFEDFTLQNISAAHIRLLAKAHAISQFDFIINIGPKFLLQSWLKTRASELIHDDQLLLRDGYNDLSHTELMIACLRRGINPRQNSELLKGKISIWLRNFSKISNIGMNPLIIEMYILHAALVLEDTINDCNDIKIN